jgi:pyruvate dehydrogenase E1 component beta subunit
LEHEFYPDPAKIAKVAHAMVRPKEPAWEPDPTRAKLTYQLKFRGPF